MRSTGTVGQGRLSLPFPLLGFSWMKRRIQKRFTDVFELVVVRDHVANMVSEGLGYQIADLGQQGDDLIIPNPQSYGTLSHFRLPLFLVHHLRLEMRSPILAHWRGGGQ